MLISGLENTPWPRQVAIARDFPLRSGPPWSENRRGGARQLADRGLIHRSSDGVIAANPSEDIGATRDIVAVIQGGVVLDRSTLVFDEASDPGF